MFERVEEVVKDTKGILRIFLKENNYQVNPEKDDSQIEGQSRKNTSPPVVHVHTKVSQDETFVQIDQVEQESVDDTTDNQVVDNSGEAMQDPPQIEIIVEMIAKEIGKEEKGEGDSEKVEEDVREEQVEKEKGEEKTEEALVTMTKAIVADK